MKGYVAMEEKNIIDLGSEDTFYVSNGGNIFGIAFDKIFEHDALEPYNGFSLTSKRNFKNLATQILETYEELFLDDGGRFKEELALILYNILNVKKKIILGDVKSFDSFRKAIDNITDSGNGLLLRTVSDYIENNYALTLDKITEETREKKKKVNEELQFLDLHAKDLLKISYLYRTMIPVIAVYFDFNKSLYNGKIEDEEDESEDSSFADAVNEVFNYLFEKITKEHTEALKNKLYKLTMSRISKTAFSDKRFWNMAKQLSITIETETLEIYKKIMNNAIAKLSIDADKNVISFLQSVINNQIDFLFQSKFKYKFVPLTNNTEKYGISNDDDEMSEFEKMEIQMTRRDEGAYIVRKLNIADILEKIPERLGVGVDDSEVAEMIKTLNRNTIQEEIVALITFKHFKDRDALKFINFFQYCYLVIACKKYLEMYKLKYISQILTADCEKHRERLNICGRRVRPEILSSKKYNDLFEAKYHNFSDDVERPLLSFIGTVYSSTFKDKNGEEIFDSSVKVGRIAEELLDLIQLI